MKIPSLPSPSSTFYHIFSRHYYCFFFKYFIFLYLLILIIYVHLYIK